MGFFIFLIQILYNTNYKYRLVCKNKRLKIKPSSNLIYQWFKTNYLIIIDIKFED